MQSSQRDVYLGAYLNGGHWQMLVILPKEHLVVWFCSLHNRPDNYLKGIINSAIKGLDDAPCDILEISTRNFVNVCICMYTPGRSSSIKAPTFVHHFCSKSRKETIFGVVKRTYPLWDFTFQIVMAAQLIHDRVEMECLEGVWETLEGNARCRFRGTIRLTATSLVHPEEPARTLQRTVEWILPTPTPYLLVEPVQVIEVMSSEEDPEEDPEELPLEPAMDALDFLESDEDPLPEVDSPEDVMSASEADSMEESGPGGIATSGDKKELLSAATECGCPPSF
ncbi:hypothetical protein GmHk_15G044952 [Glycine max]|nr:hypothetical protein GmHk_15G044952 [Glycine max]